MNSISMDFTWLGHFFDSPFLGSVDNQNIPPLIEAVVVWDDRSNSRRWDFRSTMVKTFFLKLEKHSYTYFLIAFTLGNGILPKLIDEAIYWLKAGLKISWPINVPYDWLINSPNKSINKLGTIPQMANMISIYWKL